MGRDAWHVNPRFREDLEEVDGLFAKTQKWSIIDMLFDDTLMGFGKQASRSRCRSLCRLRSLGLPK